MTYKVGLVGLGAMGLPMGKRLLASGYDLSIVPHVSRQAAEELIALGAHDVARPSALVHHCDILITSVPDVPQVNEVLYGPSGLASEPLAGKLFIDLSTTNPSAAADIHSNLAKVGCAALDAPVSGGPARAGDGTLTIMVGAEDKDFDRALPFLRTLGNNVLHVGKPGAGQAVKLVNQLMISIIMMANAEALSLGVKAGVPLQTLLDVIGTSSGSNYLMQSWLPRTLFAGEMETGFSLELLMKDLRAALQWASELGAPAFGGALAQQLYRLVATTEPDPKKLDYSVVARLYESANEVQLRRDAG